ncbi:MAG: hypothetical protein KDA22_13600 [Phycisphaerales bacterium]|nr:hypothetical protein [Phycisphaerales bacterium]
MQKPDQGKVALSASVAAAGKKQLHDAGRLCCVASALFLMCPVSADGLPCGYDTTEILGPWIPPLGQSKVRFSDINESDLAVGHDYFVPSARKPCTWTAEEGVKLIPNDAGNWDWVEMIPIAKAPSESFVHDLNDENQVVGTQSAGRSGNYPQAGFLWSLETGRVDIAIEGWVSTGCIAINDAGTIAGDVSLTAQASGFQSTHAFVLHEGEASVIEPVPPYDKSDSRSINNLGTVAGTMSSNTVILRDGYTMNVNDGKVVIYPAPPSASRWWPRDINDLGIISGDLDLLETNSKRACVTDGTTFLELTPFAPASASYLSQALAIRNDGVMVVNCNVICAAVLAPVAGILGDLDCDDVVGPCDLAIVVGAWGTDDAIADLNADGVVSGADLGVVLGNWTQP